MINRYAFSSLGFLALFGCAASASPALIVDETVDKQVRLAATCYSFNAWAERYVFGVQLEMQDYDSAAAFWDRRLSIVEPSEDFRGALLESARDKMDTDFPRRSAPESPNQYVFNATYATVVSMCETEREALEVSQDG